MAQLRIPSTEKGPGTLHFMTGLGKEFDIFGPKNGDQLEFRSKMVEFGQNEHKIVSEDYAFGCRSLISPPKSPLVP